ncbi:hypothetical protein JCM7447_15760 [Corynebacterium amycolatum]
MILPFSDHQATCEILAELRRQRQAPFVIKLRSIGAQKHASLASYPRVNLNVNAQTLTELRDLGIAFKQSRRAVLFPPCQNLAKL